MLLIPQKNDQAVKQRWTGIQDTIYYDQVISPDSLADGSVAITGYTNGAGQRKVMRAWKQRGGTEIRALRTDHFQFYFPDYNIHWEEVYSLSELELELQPDQHVLESPTLVNTSQGVVLFYRKLIHQEPRVFYRIFNTITETWGDEYQVQDTSGGTIASYSEIKATSRINSNHLEEIVLLFVDSTYDDPCRDDPNQKGTYSRWKAWRILASDLSDPTKQWTDVSDPYAKFIDNWNWNSNETSTCGNKHFDISMNTRSLFAGANSPEEISITLMGDDFTGTGGNARDWVKNKPFWRNQTYQVLSDPDSANLLSESSYPNQWTTSLYELTATVAFNYYITTPSGVVIKQPATVVLIPNSFGFISIVIYDYTDYVYTPPPDPDKPSKIPAFSNSDYNDFRMMAWGIRQVAKYNTPPSQFPYLIRSFVTTCTPPRILH